MHTVHFNLLCINLDNVARARAMYALTEFYLSLDKETAHKFDDICNEKDIERSTEAWINPKSSYWKELKKFCKRYGFDYEEVYKKDKAYLQDIFKAYTEWAINAGDISVPPEFDITVIGNPFAAFLQKLN